MKEIIETLYPMDRHLTGAGYDNAMEFLSSLIDLDVIEIPAGTSVGNWEVPQEWVLKDAWVKFHNRKILDVKKQPLAVATYSKPVHKKVDLEELKKHLKSHSELKDATPFSYHFYEDNWSFNIPYRKFEKLKEGEYEVFVDAEFKPSPMKIGVHTIPGKSDREILLFAHLDHPYQANDNLSGVACLVDIAKKLDVQHTVRIIFCPETIGSIAYAHTQDISKVDLVIAVDICGNDRDVLAQKAFGENVYLNRVLSCTMQSLGKTFRLGQFRQIIGSDEYVFNDPQIGIPGLMLSTHPYDEYHTSEDTPDKINYDKIKEMQEVIMKIIEIYEKDYIPLRLNTGPVMRSKYDIQSPNDRINLIWDYFFYSIDGKTPLTELCSDFQMSFDLAYEALTELENDGQISRISIGKKPQQTTPIQE